MNKNVVIIGSGSHSKSVYDCLDKKKINLLGYVDNKIKNNHILVTINFFFRKNKIL